MKTPENYLALLNDALRIPSGPDWNYRFRKELKAKGLTLSMSIKDEEKVFYPNEFPVVAPLSYDLNDGWPKESLIVWEDTPMTTNDYEAACAERARDDRWAAEACNDLLSATQANVLRLAMDCMPEAAVFLAETVFEQYGWPDAGLDATWLDATGRVTWSCYSSYNAIWQAEIRNARGAA